MLDLSNLLIWAPNAKYMLAMKCMSARFDSSDGDDIRFLVSHLGLTSAQEVLDIVEKYYPKSVVEPKTQFFIEELFDQ